MEAGDDQLVGCLSSVNEALGSNLSTIYTVPGDSNLFPQYTGDGGKEQKVRVILSCVVSLRLSWATGEPVSSVFVCLNTETASIQYNLKKGKWTLSSMLAGQESCFWDFPLWSPWAVWRFSEWGVHRLLEPQAPLRHLLRSLYALHLLTASTMDRFLNQSEPALQTAGDGLLGAFPHGEPQLPGRCNKAPGITFSVNYP